MPPVRLSEIPGLSPTSGHVTPRINPRAAVAPARALGEVAEGIASLGKAFKGIAEDSQNAINAAAESDARSGWRLRAGELAIKIDSEPDLGKRLELSNQFLQNERAIFESSDAAPIVKERLRPQFSEFADTLHLRNTAAVSSETKRRAGLTLEMEFEDAAKRNDRAGYNAAKETARTAGLLDPITEERLDRDFEGQVTFNSLVKEIDDGGAVDVYNTLSRPDAQSLYPDLDADQLDNLRRRSFSQGNRQKAEFWDSVLGASMNEGDAKAILPKETLAELHRSGYIDADQRASYLRAYYSSTDPDFDPIAYQEAYGAISQYDPATDPTGATLAAIRSNLATVPLPREALKELNDRLGERVKPDKRPEHRLAPDYAKLTTAKFNNGEFGNWYSYQDTDGDPSTAARRVITPGDYSKALATQRRFLDAWDVVVRQLPDDADPVKVQSQYSELFERIVLDNDDSTSGGPAVPAAPGAVDYGRDVDSILGKPVAPAADKATAGGPATFGNQPILAPGSFYRRAVATVFGGKSDPVDNGLSAFGGATGPGAREGVAIPQDILKANFPGKDKKWLSENVRVVVRTNDGRQGIFSVADFGTHEDIWKRNGRPTLDLTEGAVRQMGGATVYRNGQLNGVQGLGDLSFAITTKGGGLAPDYRGKTLQQAQDEWWKEAKPTTTDQIVSGLAVVRTEWQQANVDMEAPAIPEETAKADDIDEETVAGSVLPPLDDEDLPPQ